MHEPSRGSEGDRHLEHHELPGRDDAGERGARERDGEEAGREVSGLEEDGGVVGGAL